MLVDPDEGRARGKALDIAQSGPVDRFDTRVEACASPADAGEVSAWVVADSAGLPDGPLTRAAAAAVLAPLLPRLGRAVLLVAGAQPAALLEAAVRSGTRSSRRPESRSPEFRWSGFRRRRCAARSRRPGAGRPAQSRWPPPRPGCSPRSAGSAARC